MCKGVVQDPSTTERVATSHRILDEVTRKQEADEEPQELWPVSRALVTLAEHGPDAPDLGALERVIKLDPGNILARFILIEILAKSDRPIDALVPPHIPMHEGRPSISVLC